MTTEQHDTQLTINVEVGAGYQPSPRLASVLDELASVVREECGEPGGEDTAGFSLHTGDPLSCGSFTAHLSPSGSKYTVQPKLEKTKTVRM
jgi:hypothetical protein